MKSIKNLALLFAAIIIGLGAAAQQAAQTTPASQTTAQPVKQGTVPPKDVPKPDAVDKTMKGPKGETVYTGPKGGKYYMDASGNKKYLKQDKPAGAK